MTALLVAAAAAGLLAGPVLAGLALRIADTYRDVAEDDDGGAPRRTVVRTPVRPGPVRVVVVALALAGLLVGAVLLVGGRPVLAGLAWGAAAAVVLAQVDLAVHRLPDRVVFPAAAVVVVAQLADAVVLGSWDALLRALLAGAAAFGISAAAAMVGPGMGFGDVKLLGALGLVLGWFGWSVLLVGVLLGFVVGALGALAMVAGRRAGWRTELALGPSLLVGAVLVLALPGLLPGG